jgi:hypothetical protein
VICEKMDSSDIVKARSSSIPFRAFGNPETINTLIEEEKGDYDEERKELEVIDEKLK